MDNNANPQQALIAKLKDAKNVLVTVRTDPSVDLLAACLGLTIWLNKAGKHATAVFSGDVPSTIEFLQPEETLEKNTDSLRDFIIALDKSKADKLRYKVEDRVVKIFITPYRTSLSADDLEYSQGDFNVDMVIALGVSVQQDLDTAITAHGRILHDATVATITTGENPSELGSISWHDAQASSISELAVEVGNALGRDQLDNQIATALLTGIVAETERFSNEKTTPQTMSVSAELMAAGANQQLVASKLEEAQAPVEPEAAVPSPEETEKPATGKDGTLQIDHPDGETTDFVLPEPAPEATEETDQKEDEQVPPVPEPEIPAITDVKETEPTQPESEEEQPTEPNDDSGDDSEQLSSRLMTEPPLLGGTLTANSRPEDIMDEPPTDPLSQSEKNDQDAMLTHDTPGADPADDQPSEAAPEPQPATEAAPDAQPAPPAWMPPQPWMNQPAPAEPAQPSEAPFTPAPAETLEQIEREVNSPHLQMSSSEEPTESTNKSDDVKPDLDSARDEVMKALESTPDTSPEPVQALNAQPIELTPPAETETPADAGPALPSTTFDPSAFEVANDPEALQPPAGPQAPEPSAEEMSGPVEQPFTMPLPNTLSPPPANPLPPTSTNNDPTAPPPVPPPLPFTPGPRQ